MGEHLYQLKITASGEVRDADGNLISAQPVEAVRTVTEAEALDILTSAAAEEERGTR